MSDSSLSPELSPMQHKRIIKDALILAKQAREKSEMLVRKLECLAMELSPTSKTNEDEGQAYKENTNIDTDICEKRLYDDEDDDLSYDDEESEESSLIHSDIEHLYNGSPDSQAIVSFTPGKASENNFTDRIIASLYTTPSKLRDRMMLSFPSPNVLPFSKAPIDEFDATLTSFSTFIAKCSPNIKKFNLEKNMNHNEQYPWNAFHSILKNNAQSISILGCLSVEKQKLITEDSSLIEHCDVDDDTIKGISILSSTASPNKSEIQNIDDTLDDDSPAKDVLPLLPVSTKTTIISPPRSNVISQSLDETAGFTLFSLPRLEDSPQEKKNLLASNKKVLRSKWEGLVTKRRLFSSNEDAIDRRPLKKVSRYDSLKDRAHALSRIDTELSSSNKGFSLKKCIKSFMNKVTDNKDESTENLLTPNTQSSNTSNDFVSGDDQNKEPQPIRNDENTTNNLLPKSEEKKKLMKGYSFSPFSRKVSHEFSFLCKCPACKKVANDKKTLSTIQDVENLIGKVLVCKDP